MKLYNQAHVQGSVLDVYPYPRTPSVFVLSLYTQATESEGALRMFTFSLLPCNPSNPFAACGPDKTIDDLVECGHTYSITGN